MGPTLPLPAGVRPSLANARKDTESLFRDGCAAQVPTTEPPDCVYGDPAGRLTIALVGDSHAGQWFPAFEALASARGWRLLPYVKLSCPFIDMRVEHLTLKREYTECAAWRERVTDVLADRESRSTTFGLESALATYPGMFPTAPPAEGTPYGIYWPTAVPAERVRMFERIATDRISHR